ncbi:replication initiation protein [Leisingera sp. ANG-Vp]|nr:replication initiation protein [Leisingera sp. ANG-Vp]
MGYMPLTPFGRTVEAVLLHQQAATERAIAPAAVNKWDVLRELAAARKHYGLNDRDLTVLQALLSFLPGKMIEPSAGSPVVHPANQTICERLNGMPCSSMRRHLAKLVSAGLLIRRDSPNGKRYVRRYGGERVAYGFDLSPLARRFAEISDAAEAERALQARIKQLRETVSLMRRDLANLALLGEAEHPDVPHWTRFQDCAVLTARSLRRKLGLDELQLIASGLEQMLTEVKTLLEPVLTEELSTSDSQIEQHYQNSKKDSYESEQAAMAAHGSETIPQKDMAYAEKASAQILPDHTVSNQTPRSTPTEPNISLRLILASCGEIRSYAEGGITNWSSLQRAADTVRPMMGISSQVWEEAKRAMGAAEASVVVAAMLERFGDIRSPSAYLRSLSAKALAGTFSSGPMVVALSRRAAA